MIIPGFIWSKACALLGFSVASSVALADEGGLELLAGHWDIRVQILQPERTVVNYKERYEPVLDGKFIRGHTGLKPDGSEDIVFGTYDAKVDGYPFWIFSSSGSHISLPPGTFDARRRTMEWKTPAGWDINYRSRCHFPDARLRRCTLIIKDWKGKVLLEQESTAVRRND
ncbi:MAG: hypothetical protein Q7J47_15360 [Azoarcus sp.]|nr:hypothetical protein [Azoarcus sp.]